MPSRLSWTHFVKSRSYEVWTSMFNSSHFQGPCGLTPSHQPPQQGPKEHIVKTWNNIIILLLHSLFQGAEQKWGPTNTSEYANEVLERSSKANSIDWPWVFVCFQLDLLVPRFPVKKWKILLASLQPNMFRAWTRHSYSASCFRFVIS